MRLNLDICQISSLIGNMQQRGSVSYLKNALAPLASLQLSFYLVVVLLQSFSPANASSTPDFPLMVCRNLAPRATLQIEQHFLKAVLQNMSFECNTAAVHTPFL